jgi:hypothetical protein
MQQNPIGVSPRDQFPASTCPICDEPSATRRRGMFWCTDCRIGWETPRQYARRRRLRPFEMRLDLAGRRPWHFKGRPIVVVRGGPA